jgi:hypothetical protein
METTEIRYVLVPAQSVIIHFATASLVKQALNGPQRTPSEPGPSLTSESSTSGDRPISTIQNDHHSPSHSPCPVDYGPVMTMVNQMATVLQSNIDKSLKGTQAAIREHGRNLENLIQKNLTLQSQAGTSTSSGYPASSASAKNRTRKAHLVDTVECNHFKVRLING